MRLFARQRGAGLRPRGPVHGFAPARRGSRALPHPAAPGPAQGADLPGVAGRRRPVEGGFEQRRLRPLQDRIRLDVLPRWERASGRDALSGAALSRELLEEDDRALEAWVDLLRPIEAEARCPWPAFAAFPGRSRAGPCTAGCWPSPGRENFPGRDLRPSSAPSSGAPFQAQSWNHGLR